MRACIFFLFLIFPFTAFSEGQSTSKADPILRIGLIQSLTGIAAEDGYTVLHAVQLAEQDLAEQGKRIEVLVEDDQSDAKKAVAAFKKLLAEKVDVIIGGTWDFTTNALAPLAQIFSIPVFSTSILPESLDPRSKNPFVFVNAQSIEDEVEPFQQYLLQNNFKSFSMVYANNSWGLAQRDLYKKIAEKAGLRIKNDLPSNAMDNSDWGLAATQIVHAKSDLVVMLLNKNDLQLLTDQLRTQRYAGGIFASKNAYDTLKISAHPQSLNGLCFSYPLQRLEQLKAFRTAYKKLAREEPRIYADNSYDAVFLLQQAFEDSRAKRISLGDALRVAHWKGLVGNYQYSSDRSFSIGESSLTCVENARLALH